MALQRKAVAFAGIAMLAGLGLSGCATEDYVDQHIATVNTRIDGVDAHLRQVEASAQQANAAAQQADQRAQAAAALAQQANQAVAGLDSRVTTLEQHPSNQKRPRN